MPRNNTQHSRNKGTPTRASSRNAAKTMRDGGVGGGGGGSGRQPTQRVLTSFFQRRPDAPSSSFPASDTTSATTGTLSSSNGSPSPVLPQPKYPIHTRVKKVRRSTLEAIGVRRSTIRHVNERADLLYSSSI